MLKVQFSAEKEYCLVITLLGHCSDNHGTDLVCAGMSSIITGFCNYLIKENIKKDVKIKLKDGNCVIKFVKIPNNVKISLKLLFEQILTLQRDNQEKIKIQGDLYAII